MRIRVDHLRRVLVTALSLTSMSCAVAAAATTHAGGAAAAPPLMVGHAHVPASTVPPVISTGHHAVVVALVDSVPAGSACDCRNFVAGYADLVSHRTHHTAAVTNLARGGAETEDVLEQLKQPDVRRALDDATTVLLMIGANDFYRPFCHVQRGGSTTAAYRPVARQVQSNLEETIRQIRALHDGPVKIVVLGYWNVVEDGRVARRDYGAVGVAAAESATTWANRALKAAARSADAVFVPTYEAFKGADGHKDPTSLLAADGDHPNAAGHRVLARTVYAPLPTG